MTRHARRGAALPLVLWTLVIGGALFTAAVVVTVHEQRLAGSAGRQQRAFSTAETRGSEALLRWSAGALLALLPRPLDSLALASGTGWTTTVHRLTAGVFLLEASARIDGDGGSVRMGWLVHAVAESVVLAAAASVAGAAYLGDGVTISGIDQPLPGRSDCPPPDSSIAGVVAAATTVSGTASVSGAPPLGTRVAAESGLAAADRRMFDDFASRADLVLAPGSYSTHPATVGTACNLLDIQNWGDPTDPVSPCGVYSPTIRIAGPAELVGGVGQGILLVDGDLHILSAYRFDGLVYVNGLVDARAQFIVHGAIAARALGSETGHLTQVEVSYSKCIIDNVLQKSASLASLPSRAWKLLYRAP